MDFYCVSGEPLRVTSEQDIFNYLGMEPNERNV